MTKKSQKSSPPLLPEVYLQAYQKASDDPKTFVSVFVSPGNKVYYEPTPPQLEFLAAIGSGRFNEGWSAGGNSSGKTWTAKFLAIWFATYKKKPNYPWPSYDEYLRAPYSILCTGPESKQAMELWQHIEEGFKKSPFLKNKVEEIFTGTRRNIHPYIRLKNGSVIEAIGLHDKGRHVEGQAYDLILINEPADVRNLVTVYQKVLTPRTWRRGGIICGFGTPKGKNEFYLLWRKGKAQIDGAANPSFDPAVFAMYTDSRSNPHANQETINRYLLTQNEGLIEERIRGQFTDSAFNAFKDSLVEACVDSTLPLPIAPSTNHEYITGVDFGRKLDYTVATTIDLSVKPFCVVDFYRAGGGLVTWENIFSDLLKINQRYNSEFIYDSTAASGDLQGEWLGELDIPLIPYQFAGSPAKKVRLINNLQDMIEKKQIRIPDIYDLIEELHLYPADLEDKNLMTDCVMSLALAAWGANQYGPLGAVESYHR